MVILNSGFLSQLLSSATEDSYGWVCSFRGDPGEIHPSDWYGRPYLPGGAAEELVDSWGDLNTYFSVALLAGEPRGRTKQNFRRLLALVVDDVQEFHGHPSWVLGTSPGKLQAGVFIDPEDPDGADAGLVSALMHELYLRKLLGDNSGNNLVRYVRLPVGTNAKRRESGPYRHEMQAWNPGQVLSLADAAGVFGIDLDEVRKAAPQVADFQPLGEGQDKLMADAMQRIVTGEDYHDSINRVAASMLASGARPGAVVNLLRGLMSAAQAPRDDRWQQRYEDIPRSVETGAVKYLIEPIAQPGEPVEKPALLMRADAMLERIRPIRWVVRDMLEGEAMSMLFGPPNVGKSFVALDMACCVATGTAWQGKAVEKGPVVLVVGEGLPGVIRRLQAWSQERGVSLKGAQLFVTTRSVPMLNAAAAAELVESVDSACVQGESFVSPTMVVIDTLARNFGEGDENSAKDASRFIETLDEHLRRRYRAHVMIVHHSGHEAGRARGSSAFKGAMDQEFGVAPFLGGELIKLECKKMKDAPRFQPIEFRLEEVFLGEDDYGDAITSAVLKRASNPIEDILVNGKDVKVTVGQFMQLATGKIMPSQRTVIEKLNISKRQAENAWKRLDELGYIDRGGTTNSGTRLSERALLLLSQAGMLVGTGPEGEEGEDE